MLSARAPWALFTYRALATGPLGEPERTLPRPRMLPPTPVINKRQIICGRALFPHCPVRVSDFLDPVSQHSTDLKWLSRGPVLDFADLPSQPPCAECPLCAGHHAVEACRVQGAAEFARGISFGPTPSSVSPVQIFGLPMIVTLIRKRDEVACPEWSKMGSASSRVQAPDHSALYVNLSS